MARTEIDGEQIYDGSVQKKDLDITTVGESVVTGIAVIGTGLVLTETGADSGTGIASLKLSSGNFGTQFYYFQDKTENTTTSNLWVEKLNVTTPIVPSGNYILHYRAQLTNTNKKSVGFQVQWQEDALALATAEESFNSPSLANVYETRAAFEEIQVLNDNTITITVNFGQTTGGGTGKIKNVALYLFKVGEL